MTSNKRNRMIGRLILGLSSTFTFLPVIAGILTPMLWLLPVWYGAWSLIEFIFPFSPIWGGLWLPITNPLVGLIVYIVQGIAFVAGLALFIRALLELTRGISNGESLVTSGTYRWTRHPQHLGIILFLLPIALFNISSSISWMGIRPGDILSWSLVSFMLIVVADLEERALAMKLGAEYIDYCKRTPFLLPRVSIFGFTENYDLLSRGKPLRYILWFVLYWCTVSLILYGFTFVELAWTL